MRVSVYQHETLIGTGTLEHLDPPMGVAFGPFIPEHYDRDIHANTVEGTYVDDRGKSLSISAAQHGGLITAAIAIEDCADAGLGRGLTVWFQDGRYFAAIFSSHADFKAYYPD